MFGQFCHCFFVGFFHWFSMLSLVRSKCSPIFRISNSVHHNQLGFSTISVKRVPPVVIVDGIEIAYLIIVEWPRRPFFQRGNASRCGARKSFRWLTFKDFCKLLWASWQDAGRILRWCRWICTKRILVDSTTVRQLASHCSSFLIVVLREIVCRSCTSMHAAHRKKLIVKNGGCHSIAITCKLLSSCGLNTAVREFVNTQPVFPRYLFKWDIVQLVHGKR